MLNIREDPEEKFELQIHQNAKTDEETQIRAEALSQTEFIQGKVLLFEEKTRSELCCKSQNKYEVTNQLRILSHQY